MISIDSTLNNQLSTINCFNEERHMSERVFYPDTDDVSSTSKVVALSIARNRTRELILSAQQPAREGFRSSIRPGRIRRGGGVNDSPNQTAMVVRMERLG